jgi:hypothetical protein
MKNFPLIVLILISVIVLNACNKEISAPEQNANGSNVMYIKVDDKEEFLLESRNKRLHKKTAGKFSDYDSEVIRHSEFIVNNRTMSNFSIYIAPYYPQKAAFQKASIIIRFDKLTQQLDTAYLNKNLKKTWSSVINFSTLTNVYKSYYIDSIIDYKLLKWDIEKKTISFWANCSYSRDTQPTPMNPRIYFYFDLTYAL